MCQAIKVAHTSQSPGPFRVNKQITRLLTGWEQARMTATRHSSVWTMQETTVASCSSDGYHFISPLHLISPSPESKVHRKGSRLWRLIMQAKLYENEGAWRPQGCQLKHPYHGAQAGRGSNPISPASMWLIEVVEPLSVKFSASMLAAGNGWWFSSVYRGGGQRQREREERQGRRLQTRKYEIWWEWEMEEETDIKKLRGGDRRRRQRYKLEGREGEKMW